jgi:hypothetical protein
MPINRDLNVDPYFDDFDLEKQFYRVLFKPSYAVQARELTQMQTMLQNQIEQFGDNIFKEGSIIKGCNFTELGDLNYVKVTDKTNFDPTAYVGFEDTIEISGETYSRDNTYELRGAVSGVKARVVAASRGFETRNPDLNTFYINYTTTSSGNKVFQPGERIDIYKISTVEVGTSINRSESFADDISVTTFSGAVGDSFGLRSAPGIIFQKGHFLYSDEQLVIISKYTNVPDNVSVGFVVQERIINAFQDSSLYDNANGSFNQNAPGADRLKLIPVLTSLPTTEADSDTTFFTLTRYSSGNPVLLRNVSQYNALGEEMARRTFEESGDYIVKDFSTKVIRRGAGLKASIGSGLAYVKGYRIENLAEIILDIDEIANTSIDERTNQAVSFNYGSYLNLVNTSAAGTVTLGDFSTVSLKDEANSNAGTARVRNVTNDKIFLFDIRLTGSNKITDIERIVGTDGVLYVANNSTIQQAGLGAMIFDTGMQSLKSMSQISIPVRTSRTLSGQSGNTVTLSAGDGEDFGLSNDDILYVDDNNLKIDVEGTTVSGNNIIISLSSNTTAAATVYFNKRVVNATPFTKASTELYVKCTFANTDIDTPAKYNLGFPDVYEIVSITDAGSNDVTGSFRLRTNQRDNYYDHSYVEFIPGRPAPVDGLMTVRMKAFKLNDTAGQYFFTVDSYPDDVAKNKIQIYKSSGGRTFNPRDCVDFRPYADPIAGATYGDAEVLGTAPTVSNSSTGVNVSPSFTLPSGREILTPAFDQFGQVNYEYYLSRTDLVTIDSYGKIAVVKGTEAELAPPPMITGDQIKIAEIYIPGFPALTPDEALSQNQLRYSVKLTPRGVKSYRMKDIENIEKKVDSLKYYVLLSALEAETQNLNIIDENGLTRFKNGIIVDPFNDLSIANLENTEFNAAIDFTERSLMPAVKTFPLNLKYSSSSSASIFPSTANAKVATLQRNTDVSIISQPYATEFRNCVSNFYSYRGIGVLVPEYDSVYDTVTNPISIDIDLVTPFQQFTDALQEFVPLTSTASRVIESSLVNPGRRGFLGIFGRRQATWEDRWEDTTRTLDPTGGGELVNEQAVGDFVTNFSFNPYMRARDVNIYMGGLRPNTIHYFFFDEVDVNQYITPGSNVDDPDLIQRFGVAGGTVTSDASGVIRAVFSLPAETFYVGDRKLEVVDVDLYSAIESGATSYGEVTYRAYNFSVEKASLTVATRTPQTFITETVTTDRTTTRRARAAGGKDPIAQTFFIKSGMGLGSDTVFVSKIDLFFKRKSDINGVTVELREVINGYPSYTVLPFSKVHLTPSQVNTSDDASAVTVINFPAPVRLDVEKEYAVVVMPDASDPDYLVFTSKVGGVNLTPGANKGLSVVQDWGDGVLFTSTNGTAWYSYQDEDLKFSIYRHNFNVSSGSVTLINDDHEFITLGTTTGVFKVGEKVYSLKSRDASTANTVSVVTGNNNITGTNLSTTYAAGDYILLDDNSTNRQIFRVNSANSTVIVADRPASFTDAVDGTPIVLGTLVTYNSKYPDFIILEGSTATSARKFSSSDVIYGFDSDAQGTISNVSDINFSYIQPIITRTNDSVTRTSLSGTFVDPAVTTNTYTKDIPFNDKTTFTGKGMVVFSKSNDIVRTKGLKLTVNMSNASNVTSTPFVDIETASLLAYQHKITNDSATTSKYISKTVELVESLDAEDMQVFVTAYRPNGTDVKVYIKPQAANDPSTFETNDWIELEITEGQSQYSSVSNIRDFREFVYRVPSSEKPNGVLSYTNGIATFEGYRRFAIKIELHSENIFKAPRLLDYRGIALT